MELTIELLDSGIRNLLFCDGRGVSFSFHEDFILVFYGQGGVNANVSSSWTFLHFRCPFCFVHLPRSTKKSRSGVRRKYRNIFFFHGSSFLFLVLSICSLCICMATIWSYSCARRKFLPRGNFESNCTHHHQKKRKKVSELILYDHRVKTITSSATNILNAQNSTKT